MWPFKAIEKAVKDVGKVVEDVVNVVGDAVEDEVKVTADRFRKHKGKKILIYDASRCKNKKKKKGVFAMFSMLHIQFMSRFRYTTHNTSYITY